MKSHRVFQMLCTTVQYGYLSSHMALDVDLYWRMEAQPPLEMAEIVVGNITPGSSGSTARDRQTSCYNNTPA